MFFAVLITGCGATLKPINTLQRINRPVVIIEAARLPDVVLKHYTAEIPFLAGDYSTYADASMAEALAALSQFSGQRTLKIEGYSYSKGDSASQLLALKRASVVANVLIASGYDPRTIQQVGIHANHLKTIPFVGAKIHWVSSTPPIVIPESLAAAAPLKTKPVAIPKAPIPLKTIVELSVGFAPGNYTTPDVSGLQSLLTTLEQDLEIVEIKIEGHSYSQGLHASERLALMRARVVREALVAAGIKRAIKITGVFANNVAQSSPFTGVRAYLTYPHKAPDIALGIAQSAPVVPPTHLHIGKEIESPKRREGLTDGVEGTSPPTDKERVILIQTSTVYVLHVEQGSLRDNIERILKEHNYSFGQWRFARPGVSYDWNIPKRFSYPLMGGLPEILAVLSRLYEFQATINELDRTVDFHSINEVLPSA